MILTEVIILAKYEHIGRLFQIRHDPVDVVRNFGVHARAAGHTARVQSERNDAVLHDGRLQRRVLQRSPGVSGTVIHLVLAVGTHLAAVQLDRVVQQAQLPVALVQRNRAHFGVLQNVGNVIVFCQAPAGNDHVLRFRIT